MAGESRFAGMKCLQSRRMSLVVGDDQRDSGASVEQNVGPEGAQRSARLSLVSEPQLNDGIVSDGRRGRCRDNRASVYLFESEKG